MNETLHRQYQAQLNTWLEDLLEQAGHSIRNLRDMDVHAPETLDMAALESNRSLALRLRDREHLLIRKILQSLQDIEAGTYGICAACGDEIGLKRLQARPIARYCIRCKTDMERRERLTGS